MTELIQRAAVCTFLAVVALCGSSDFAAAADRVAACTSLASSPPHGVRITVADVVSVRDDLPLFCRVAGEISPAIGFEMRMPIKDWNGRFLMSGCGGYCGEVLPERTGYSNSINYALRRGYAATTTDSGHRGTTIDPSWGYNNRAAEEMYAHAWVPLATAASREILERVYGGRERYAYFSGCSNGGRTAAKVAQRYPFLFDGIASGAPALNVTYAAGVQGVWLDRTLVDVDGQLILRADKISLLSQAVQNRCDAQDGLTDSIVSDPFACDFDPGSLQCSDDVDDTRCLTAAEVDELHRLYTGAHDSQGRRLYAGLPYGSEDYWGRWLIGSTGDNQHYVADLGSNFLRYLGFEQDPGPDYDSRDFDLDTDIPKLAFMARLFNASDPDLSGLQQAGGKLLMYHGLADALIVPQESIAYYESVVQKFGSPDTVNEFLRLFMVPGMDHCWGITGHAPDLFDPLRVLEEWVEENVPPTRIEARQHAEPGQFEGVGPVIRTRPLCPYPQHARYKGKGSPNAAGNFDCVGPN